MSIYIKDIEMPKTYPLTVTIYPDGQVLSETVGAKDIHGHATYVPPHGRLIDADVFHKLLTTALNSPDVTSPVIRSLMRTIITAVDNSLTIIPAEGKNHECKKDER